MKKVKYLAMLLAAGMFAACSDNLEDAGAGNAGGIDSQGETGYVKVAINLPTASSGVSRANDNFDDGEDYEYHVNDIILALFHGADESSATCQQAFVISDAVFADDNTTNVTTKSTDIVREIKKPASGNVYALVIANNSGYFQTANSSTTEVIGGQQLQVLQIKTSDTGDWTTFKGKLEDLYSQTNVITADMNKIASTTGNGNFLMMNAPIANESSPTSATPSSTFKVSTLVPVTIHTTEIDAQSAASNEIYIERAVAKVAVKVKKTDGQADNTIKIDAGNQYYPNATVLFEGWKLNTTNKKTYLIRKVTKATSETGIEDWNEWKTYWNTGESANRFFGTTKSDNLPYRVYWGIDPNYTSVGNSLADNFNTYSNSSSLSFNNMGDTNFEYCAENTTNAQNMYKDELTGILIKAKFTPAGGNADSDFYMFANSSAIYTEEQFETVILGNLGLTDAYTVTITTPTESGMTITSLDEFKKIISVTSNTDSQSATISDEAWTTLWEKVLGQNVKYYAGGVTYYYVNSAYVKHFGTTDIPESASLDEKTYLGHTGVLRNNWYELEIQSVSGPGEPDIPNIPHEPINKGHSYLNVAINVLSWAKRTQGVDL
ncbi:MAG: Mfa1 family fimbria major subunit [Candidatus Paraprevotella stercoravium]|uniref:Mfa1 family fimbria major subunit n=1 Tax=Candidatus Paraprevotella stercoravium TaxID=2838725 RepID=A0A9E2P0M8_9BACT|nr:Mfa1 family fimbria major subunit [Candidatus Paraprevotella stercoravium]